MCGCGGISIRTGLKPGVLLGNCRCESHRPHTNSRLLMLSASTSGLRLRIQLVGSIPATLGTSRAGRPAEPGHQLNRRRLVRDGFLKAIGRAPKAKGGTGSTQLEKVDDLPPFLAADNLKPFISSELRESTKPVRFVTPTVAKLARNAFYCPNGPPDAPIRTPPPYGTICANSSTRTTVCWSLAWIAPIGPAGTPLSI